MYSWFLLYMSHARFESATARSPEPPADSVRRAALLRHLAVTYVFFCICWQCFLADNTHTLSPKSIGWMSTPAPMPLREMLLAGHFAPAAWAVNKA